MMLILRSDRLAAYIVIFLAVCIVGLTAANSEVEQPRLSLQSGNDELVQAVDITEDNKTLVTASSSEIAAWDIQTGLKLLSRASTGFPRQIRMSANGEYIAVLTTGRLTTLRFPSMSDAKVIARSPTGSFYSASLDVESGADDFVIGTMDLDKAKATLKDVVRPESIDPARIIASASLSGGKHVAALTRSGDIAIFEKNSGQLIRTWNTGQGDPSILVSDAEQDLIVSAGASLSSLSAIRVWTASGNLVHEFTCQNFRPAVAISKDGTQIASDCEVLGPTPKGPLADLQKPRRLMEVRIWSLKSLALVSSINHGVNRIRSLRFSSDRSLLAGSDESNSLLVFSVNTGEKIKEIASKKRGIVQSAYCSDSGRIAVYDGDRSIQLFSMGTFETEAIIDAPNNSIKSMQCSGDGRSLVVSTNNLDVYIIDLKSGRVVSKLGLS